MNDGVRRLAQTGLEWEARLGESLLRPLIPPGPSSRRIRQILGWTLLLGGIALATCLGVGLLLLLLFISPVATLFMSISLGAALLAATLIHLWMKTTNTPMAQPQSWRRHWKRAEAGDPGAMRTLGRRYLRGGEGMPPDPAQALTWLIRAAQAGDPEAPRILAEVYEQGWGVPRNTALAQAWRAWRRDPPVHPLAEGHPAGGSWPRIPGDTGLGPGGAREAPSARPEGPGNEGFAPRMPSGTFPGPQ